MGSGIAPPPSPSGGDDDNSESGIASGEGDDDVGSSTSQTSLDNYAEEVGPTTRQGEKIDERRQRLEENLEEELDVEESHQYGSFTRGTMVGPLDEDSDTDVMFVLDESTHGEWKDSKNGAKNCLRAVKRALEKKYPNSEVSIDRNVVSVQFNDFTVEVAPAFRDSRGGYRIPDTYSQGQSWVRTDPRGYKQRFDAVNQSRDGNLQKVARVAKKFRQNSDLPVSSYHMEVMAYQYVRNHPNKQASTEELVEGFFDQLPQRLSRGTRDPVNGDRVDEHMDIESRRKAIEQARQARKKIQRAREKRQQGKTEEAEENYSEVVDEEVNDE